GGREAQVAAVVHVVAALPAVGAGPIDVDAIREVEVEALGVGVEHQRVHPHHTAVFAVDEQVGPPVVGGHGRVGLLGRPRNVERAAVVEVVARRVGD
nr:hypothetical protein [Tanacetum cinerariifolium]